VRKGLWMVSLILLSACGEAPPPTAPSGVAPASTEAESRRLTAFLDAEFDAFLALNPDTALTMGLPVHANEISDRSEAGDAKRLAWRRESVARMQAAFDPELLDETARAAFDVWAFELALAERRASFPLHPYWFGGAFGWHTFYPRVLMLYHRSDDAAGVESYAMRLRGVGRAVDQLRERTESAAAAGIRMPRFAYAKAIASSRSLISGVPFEETDEDSALWRDAQGRIESLVEAGAVSSERAITLAADVRAALLEDVAPAYRRLIGWLESDLANAPVDRVGVGAHPDGEAWYAVALFDNTTTELSAEEIHRIGLAEVARIRGEMERLKAGIGFDGSMESFFDHLRSDSRFFLPNTDEGRAQYLDDARTYLGAMEARLPDYFGLLPRAPLVVRRVEPFREEAGGAANYTPPTADGSTPGVYYVHLLDMNALPSWQLEATAYHEGSPGHHLQFAIARELTAAPRFMTAARYNAFSEGWALYAEPLAKEMGFYRDPYSDFGRLVLEQWRAVRLVLDTALHVEGMSEDDAVAYFLEHVPMPEAAARSEVQRYLMSPGQAVGYKIGMLTIQRLRDEARVALGERFDYRRFHDVVLGAGAVPLPVLEARVRRWIQSAASNGGEAAS
jgi:uncharacterized protein (DUF885 family)